ncbi:MAG: UbiA family prenyltransferase [Candidatus Diapherotrites archaeon]|nr:UbiA family prenyltransferase [Candidatus Diapherotrites archaeon]
MAWEKIRAIFELMRPLEWSKQFGNYTIGYLLAGGFSFANPIQFIYGFLLIGPLLWGGLYAFNDWTDWQKDALHPQKKLRPIPSGRLTPTQALTAALFLVLSAFAGGLLLNNLLFVVCLAAMLFNHLLYTLPPFHLKKRPVLDLISGSLIHPIFRFYAGWVLFIPAFRAPVEILAFILGIQFAGYTLYRLNSKAHEQELGYHSSVTVFPETMIKISAYLGAILGIGAFFYSIWTAILPFKFIWLGILSMASIPLVYKEALLNPQKMDIRGMHTQIYVHYLLFMAGFIALSLLPV